MNDPIAEAAVEAAEHGAPPKVWHVGVEADVDFGTGPNPYDGLVLTHWTRD